MQVIAQKYYKKQCLCQIKIESDTSLRDPLLFRQIFRKLIESLFSQTSERSRDISSIFRGKTDKVFQRTISDLEKYSPGIKDQVFAFPEIYFETKDIQADAMFEIKKALKADIAIIADNLNVPLFILVDAFGGAETNAEFICILVSLFEKVNNVCLLTIASAETIQVLHNKSETLIRTAKKYDMPPLTADDIRALFVKTLLQKDLFRESIQKALATTKWDVASCVEFSPFWGEFKYQIKPELIAQCAQGNPYLTMMMLYVAFKKAKATDNKVIAFDAEVLKDVFVELQYDQKYQPYQKTFTWIKSLGSRKRLLLSFLLQIRTPIKLEDLFAFELLIHHEDFVVRNELLTAYRDFCRQGAIRENTDGTFSVMLNSIECAYLTLFQANDLNDFRFYKNLTDFVSSELLGQLLRPKSSSLISRRTQFEEFIELLEREAQFHPDFIPLISKVRYKDALDVLSMDIDQSGNSNIPLHTASGRCAILAFPRWTESVNHPKSNYKDIPFAQALSQIRNSADCKNLMRSNLWGLKWCIEYERLEDEAGVRSEIPWLLPFLYLSLQMPRIPVLTIKASFSERRIEIVASWMAALQGEESIEDSIQPRLEQLKANALLASVELSCSWEYYEPLYLHDLPDSFYEMSLYHPEYEKYHNNSKREGPFVKEQLYHFGALLADSWVHICAQRKFREIEIFLTHYSRLIILPDVQRYLSFQEYDKSLLTCQIEFSLIVAGRYDLATELISVLLPHFKDPVFLALTHYGLALIALCQSKFDVVVSELAEIRCLISLHANDFKRFTEAVSAHDFAKYSSAKEGCFSTYFFIPLPKVENGEIVFAISNAADFTAVCDSVDTAVRRKPAR